MSRKDEIEKLKRFFNDVKLPDDVINMGSSAFIISSNI
jgi:hypothetical protein